MQQQVVKKNRREGKGRALALSRMIHRTSENLFYVESESSEIYYTVKYQPSESFILEWCTCPDYMSNRSSRCKHIYAVKYALEQKTVKDVNNFSSVAVAITNDKEPQQTKKEEEDQDIYDF